MGISRPNQSSKFCLECRADFRPKLKAKHTKPKSLKQDFCVHCGVELPRDSKFCPECGKKVEKVKESG